MTRTFFSRTKTVELQACLDAEILPKTGRQREQFDIHIGTGKAQCFATELVELAITAALRTFVAEHRAEIPQTLRCVVSDIVLNGATAHGACAFRTQSKLFAVHRIGEGIHFLFNDVGGLPHTTGKETRCLKNGRANLAVTVARRHGTRRILKLFPYTGIFGQHIVHALDPGNFDFCHCSVLVLVCIHYALRCLTLLICYPSVRPRTLRSWP